MTPRWAATVCEQCETSISEPTRANNETWRRRSRLWRRTCTPPAQSSYGTKTKHERRTQSISSSSIDNACSILVHHWVGKINHLPMSHCNLKLTKSGKLVQIKPIAAGDALSWDYGMEYWVYRITGLGVSEWLSGEGTVSQQSRKNLFARMHESVLDYSGLLLQTWVGSLSLSSTAVERETLLMELVDLLDSVTDSDS